ncbi:hypothetical protein HDV03_004924 [Kappamyces sp. JEL0829]|nr:hypothetical protein HDV03_004924 [Kappamyces sp. JEL0829]
MFAAVWKRAAVGFRAPHVLYSNIPAEASGAGNGHSDRSKHRVEVVLKDSELEEKFVRGSGNGGQKINKNMSCVQLKHVPTGITVETQRFRELMNNRKEARKLLTLKLDQLWNGSQSKMSLKIEKIKKGLARRKRRARDKYGSVDKEDPGGSI